MLPKQQLRYAVSVALALAGLASCVPGRAAASLEQDPIKVLRQQAEQLERLAAWDKACDFYEEILRLDRNQPQVRARYRHCLRRFYQVRRYRDPSYRREVLSLKYPQALDLYGLVMRSLLSSSLDRHEVGPGDVYRKGLEELRWALGDPTFCQEYLPGVPPETIRTFRAQLLRNWGLSGQLTRQQVKERVRDVAMAALQTLNLPATTTVMEFTCGGCYAFDEYTVYLTPTQLRELCDSIKGRYVGVGLRLGVQDNRLIIADVLANSPAAENGVMPGDQIVSIDKKAGAALNPEMAMDLLEGETGTMIELVIDSPSMGPRTLMLTRRPLFVPSVISDMKPGGVGYIQVACFQETTVQEIDTALLHLVKADMKSLILDLRGNGGGLVEAAIETARRFLPSGVIVSTQHQDPRQNMVYQARNPAALTLPLVVLVDGDTASAAEVLAGALKDNRRARVVGQATFGKGCSQGLLKLPAGPGGVPTGAIRVTVARLFSPSGVPYTGRGVVPHLVTPRRLMPDSLDDTDNQLAVARVEAVRLVDVPR